MKIVQAYEVNGQLYRDKKSADEAWFYDKFHQIMRSVQPTVPYVYDYRNHGKFDKHDIYRKRDELRWLLEDMRCRELESSR